MTMAIVERAYQLALKAAIEGSLDEFATNERRLQSLDRVGEIEPNRLLMMRAIAYVRCGTADEARSIVQQLGGPASRDAQAVRATLLTNAPESRHTAFCTFVDELLPSAGVRKRTSGRRRKRTFLIGAGTMSVVAAVVLAVIFWPRDESAPDDGETAGALSGPFAPINPVSADADRSNEARVYDRMLRTTAKIILRVEVVLDGGSTVMVPWSTGSGFVISRDGLLLTNRHVVESGEQALREFSDVIGWDVVVVFVGDEQHLQGRVEKQSVYVDLATIRVDRQFETVLGFAATPAPGTTVFAYGFPGIAQDVANSMNERDESQRMSAIRSKLRAGEEPDLLDWIGEANMQLNVTAGIISAIQPTEHGLMLQTQTPIHGGNSGGPLVDASGRVLGVVTFGSVVADSVNLCIAGQTVYEELARERGIDWPAEW